MTAAYVMAAYVMAACAGAARHVWHGPNTALALLEGVPAPQRTAMTRAQLPGLLGVPPDKVALRRDGRGKPMLDTPEQAGCSFAHRGPLSLVGVAWGADVGVDLEVVHTGLPVCDIADTFFTPAEAGWLRALPAHHRELGFTALWATKEAVLKASGRGIGKGLQTPRLRGADFAPLLDGAIEIRLALADASHVDTRHWTLEGGAVITAIARVTPSETA